MDVFVAARNQQTTVLPACICSAYVSAFLKQSEAGTAFCPSALTLHKRSTGSSCAGSLLSFWSSVANENLRVPKALYSDTVAEGLCIAEDRSERKM